MCVCVLYNNNKHYTTVSYIVTYKSVIKCWFVKKKRKKKKSGWWKSKIHQLLWLVEEKLHFHHCCERFIALSAVEEAEAGTVTAVYCVIKLAMLLDF